MKNLRYILLTALLVISTFSIFTYTSCQPDKCKNLTCLNGGGCAEGVCQCPTGYSGVLCEDAPVVDPCAGVVCQNGGTCSNGTCTCATGYEGTNCQTSWKTKFIGVYTGNEQCTMGTDSYAITLTDNTTDNLKINLSNLYNYNVTAVCTMTGSNSFNFSVTDSGYTYTGTGTLSGNQITITFQISGITSNACTFVGTK